MKIIHGPDVQLQLVHGSDEQSHYLSNKLAGIALVILDGDGPVLLDPLNSSRCIQPVLGHKSLHSGELLPLHLLEGCLELEQQLGAVASVLLIFHHHRLE